MFREKLEILFFKNHFFKLDELQREKHHELLERIRKKEDFVVTIENDEDFDDPPPRFDYITKNVIFDQKNVFNEISTVNSCKCMTCSEDSAECCPQLKGQNFPYKINKHGRLILGLSKVSKIIECGDISLCGSECYNRVSQRRKEVLLCLFKTKNRG